MDFNKLNMFINSIDGCKQLELSANCDFAIETFYDEIRKGFDLCISKKTVDGVVHPPWFTKTLRKLKNQKNQAHVKFKKINIYTDYAAYSLLRKKYAAL